MADEILVLEGDPSERYRLLMLFPLDGQGGNPSPVQAGGSNVVPTAVPRADGSNPDWPFSLLTAAELFGLDGGTLAYRVVRMRKEPGLTNSQLIARVQAIYAERHADFNAEYSARYQYIGTRVDAS
jgi:hypothetical protein